METRAGVTEAVLAGTELSEVSGSLGDDIVEELESDSAGRGICQKSIVSEQQATSPNEDVKILLRVINRSVILTVDGDVKVNLAIECY